MTRSPSKGEKVTELVKLIKVGAFSQVIGQQLLLIQSEMASNMGG